ncbi:hypothetical protein BSR05_04585 [Escherichia coli]|nr:hypothetical protein BSR05_04585 [Escherichia coli]
MGNPQQPLRNVVYLVAILASLHYLWSVKIISLQPPIFACLLIRSPDQETSSPGNPQPYPEV